MIIVSGEALVDFVPRAGAGDDLQNHLYEAILGGSPFNTAIGLGRLGTPTAYAARISTDANGERFAQALRKAGVDPRFIERTDAPSALALVAPGTAASGPRYAFYLRATAYDGRPPLPETWPSDVTHFHFGSIAAIEGVSGEATLAALKAARGLASSSFDPNIRPMILPRREAVLPLVEERVRLSTFVRASEEDLEWLYPDREAGATAAAWAAMGPKLALLTRGGTGAEAWFGAHHLSVAAPPVQVVDTIGAGDSFTAAWIAAMGEAGAIGPDAPELKPDDVRDWLIFACKAAAITCSRKGADPPTRAEIK